MKEGAHASTAITPPIYKNNGNSATSVEGNKVSPLLEQLLHLIKAIMAKKAEEKREKKEEKKRKAMEEGRGLPIYT